jgi:DnaK suppressor protein
MSILSDPPNAFPSTLPAPVEPFRELLERHRADCLAESELLAAALLQEGQETVTLARQAMVQDTLEQIAAALERIAAGTYGRCTRCGAAIPAERLEVRPYAPACVACS